MKTFLVITIFIFSVMNLKGQLNPMDKLFKDRPRDITLYISPTFQYSQIALQHSTIAGLGAGVILHKHFLLGVIGNLTFPDIALPEASGSGKLKMFWGGIHLEYTLWPLQPVHLTFPLSAGAGQLKITGNTAPITGNPNFIFAEQGMLIEANVWKYVKFGMGASYRYTGNVSYNNYSSGDLSGFAALVSLKFGKFRYLKRDLDKLPL